MLIYARAREVHPLEPGRRRHGCREALVLGRKAEATREVRNPYAAAHGSIQLDVRIIREVDDVGLESRRRQRRPQGLAETRDEAPRDNIPVIDPLPASTSYFLFLSRANSVSSLRSYAW
jgi:hypothetical protein